MLRKGHDLHALAFLSLYVYTIFAQIDTHIFPSYPNYLEHILDRTFTNIGLLCFLIFIHISIIQSDESGKL